MADLDLDAIEALLAEGSPLPWRAYKYGILGGPGWDSSNGDIAGDYQDDMRGEDTALIVAAVNALPALVAEVRRLRAVRDAAANLQEQREDCDNQTWVEGRTCRDAVGDEPDDWCATCALVHALEEAGRG